MTPGSSDSRESLSEGVWWFGAESGRRRRASLHFLEDGFVRAENEDGEQRDARLTELQISPRIANAPRKIIFPDGTCVAADDNDRLDAVILRRGGGRKSFALHRLEAKWTAALAIFAAAGALLFLFFARGAPMLAEFAADRIPREQTARLGDEIYAQMQQRGLLAAADISPAAEARMRRIFALVSESLAEEEDDFRLHLHNFSPNAFALPGGRVVVSDALAALLTDDELAAVFAHEIGHIRRRHGMRSALLGSAGGLLAILAGDIAGVSLGALLLNLGYSRDHEREADCFAYEYLRREGMSPGLIGSALKKMENAAPELSSGSSESSGGETEENVLFRRALAALSTHPQTGERADIASFCGARGLR